ncbi:glycosyltransferase family 4 protein [Desulfovibrio sulfodismutans]|uniref:Glycosyltransferase family 4 protein n=1 Tax=Desulfolutivibrio sulfodismutans TaxID=63561 RepID=A0A7K3NP25_9BACT|nr:glycosyltransferase family 4 protein [Desulfolutivibrio sulfodismutans]NDY57921.1 glycosyltransferase family 4 protein [Desulfolutivibrio sulfodismutans]QLA14030.1 glycosyltransferase [Desulfolutivibrio sulfodismutans DSM 3696]
MKIAFYAPMKPLSDPTPSGDATIAKGLVEFLRSRGHEVMEASALRARWIFKKPWLWPGVLWERRETGMRLEDARADLWLTYHAYYKAPDVLGPWCARRANIPYAIFQGIYSTKRAKKLGTRLGFLLNRQSLRAAAHVFTNRLLDLENLRRIIPEDRLSHVPPGIFPGQFVFDPAARKALRAELAGDGPVIATAAMFRPGVKVEGLRYLILRLGELAREGRRFRLLAAGDGVCREEIMELARRELPGRAYFLGRVPREELAGALSAADLFAFPGIRESLGMVYLEAQSVGLPVVAFDNGGVPEVVGRDETGFLTPPFDDAAFRAALCRLLDDRDLRRAMGERAEARVRQRHDLGVNYAAAEAVLTALGDRPLRELFARQGPPAGAKNR